jgi:DNA-directed RNA polymerase specialized sigma24 family protein
VGPTDEQHRRYTVDEAADILGISAGAVRNRISRSTLQSVREGGRVFVLLHADMSRDNRGLQSADNALTSALEARIESLEHQLEAERGSSAELRRLLAAALERIPPQLEAPEEPETPSESAPTTGPPETPTEGRPWWRRMFGG